MKKFVRIISVLLCIAMAVGLFAGVISAVSAAGETATLVTNVNELSNGDKIVIVGIKSNKYQALSASYSNNKYRTAVELTANSNEKNISLTDSVSVIELILISENIYALKIDDSKYLSCTSSGDTQSNQTDTTDKSTHWTISIADNKATIGNVKNTEWMLQFNASSPRFKTYKSSSNQSNPLIFKLTETTGGGTDETDPEETDPVETQPEQTYKGTATLVTDLSELTNGSQIVIVDENKEAAMGSQNNDIRTHVLLDPNYALDGNNLNIPSDAAIVTITKQKDTYALSTDDGYMVLTSDGNKVHTSTTENFCWIFAEVDDSSVFTLQNTSIKTSRYLQYNKSDDRFACYKATQKDLLIYKIPGTGDAISPDPDPEQPEQPETPAVPGFTFEKVTTAPANNDWSGIYLIASGENIFDGSVVTKGAATTAVLSGNTLIADLKYAFTIDKVDENAYTIQGSNELYYHGNGDTTLTTKIAEDARLKIENDGTIKNIAADRTLYYSSSYGFRFYKSQGSYEAVSLYKLVPKVTHTSVRLGQNLDLYFYIPAAIYRDGYKAQFVHGNKTVDATQMYQWTDEAGVKYYAFSYNGIAAQDMGDKITMNLLDAQGNLVCSAEESIASYAERGYKVEAYKPFMAALANYGAAAELYFNDTLTASTINDFVENKTPDFTIPDGDYNITSNINCYGTNLDLKSTVGLYFHFTGLTDTAGLTATVTYTNHRGKAVTLEAKMAVVTVADTQVLRVIVDTLSLADYKCLVNVVVTNAEGNEVATAVDSMYNHLVRGYSSGSAKSTDKMKALYACANAVMEESYNLFHPTATN